VIGVFNFNDKPIKIETNIEKGAGRRYLARPPRSGTVWELVPQSILSSGSKVIFVLDTYAFALYRKEGETEQEMD
jgi:hypothetical protein